MQLEFVLNPAEVEITFIRSPGPGGQNVNKVATAVVLRFNVFTSTSISDEIRQRLLKLFKSKITLQGDLIIKANRFRTQERNKQDAFERLQTLIRHAATIPKKRKKTRPTLASKQKRLNQKKLHAKTKLLRGRKHFLE